MPDNRVSLHMAGGIEETDRTNSQLRMMWMQRLLQPLEGRNSIYFSDLLALKSKPPSAEFEARF